MVFKTVILNREAEIKKEGTWKGIGLLRAMMVGGLVFGMLSVPLMLNLQTKKYISQVTTMKLKLRAARESLIDTQNVINSQIESFFPNARAVNVHGKKFYIRSK